MLTFDDIQGLDWVLITRVSDESQEDGPSLDDQKDRTKRMVERTNGTEVDTISRTESATTLERDSVDKILRMAEQDKFDVLGVPVLDRLTRADPWEAIDFMRELYENDIILCSVKRGPYDWEDLNDFRRLCEEVAFSRRHVVDIKDGMERGYRKRLQKRKWPYSDTPPACFKLGDERKLLLKPGATEVVPAVFEEYIELESAKKVSERINEEYLPCGEIQKLSENRIRSILKNRMFRGELSDQGKVYNHVDEFELVSEEMFQRAKEIRIKNNPRTNRTDEKYDGLEPVEALDHLEQLATRFGPHYTLINSLDNLSPFCEGCGDVMVWDNSSTGQSLGVEVPKFQCTSCDNERRIPNENELQAMHQVLPLRCPYCVNAENFQCEEIQQANAKFNYKITCEDCGLSWGSNMSGDKIRDYLDHPELGFSIESPEPDVENIDRGPNQSGLDNFS